MNDQSLPARAPSVATDHGLDLAIIGNGRTAALVDPTGRLVWWCYPRFDGDPVFCRLVAGDEEKGFSDVVLDEHGRATSRNISATPRPSSPRSPTAEAARCGSPISRRAIRNFGRMFRPPQLVRIIEPVAGLPRITIRVRPTHNYGMPITQRSLRQQSHPLLGRRHHHPAHHRRAALLHRARGAVRAHRAGQPGARQRRAVSRRACDHLPRVLRPHARPLDGLGAPAVPVLRLAGADHPRRDLAQAVQFRGDRRDHRRAHDVDPGSARAPAAPGTTGSAGCATPISSSRRSTASARRRRWRTSSPTSSASPRTTATRCGRSTASCRRIRSRSRSRRTSRAIAATGRCGSATPRRCRTSTTPTAASSWPRCRCSSTIACRGPATRRCFACSSRSAPRPSNWRSSRMPAFGNFAAAAASTPIRRRCAGPASTGSPRSPRGSTFTDRAAYWNARGRHASGGAAGAGLEPEAQGVHRGARHRRYSTPAFCCCPNSG